MPNTGMTVSPVLDERGNLLDFNVGNTSLSGASDPSDYVEYTDGSFRHAFADVELESDTATPTSWNLQEYVNIHSNAHPHFEGAFQWAQNTTDLPGDFEKQIFSSLEKQDLDTFNQLSEQMISAYIAAGGQPATSRPVADESYEYEDDEWNDFVDQVSDYVGGAENFERLTDYINENLSQDSIQLINDAMDNHDTDALAGYIRDAYEMWADDSY